MSISSGKNIRRPAGGVEAKFGYDDYLEEKEEKKMKEDHELYQRLSDYFEEGDIDAIKQEIRLLPREAIYYHRINELVQWFFLYSLSRGSVFDARYFKSLPFFSENGIDHERLGWAIKDCARRTVRNGFRQEEVSLLNDFGASNSDWKEAAMLALPDVMADGNLEVIDQIIEKYGLSPKEVKNEAKVAILNAAHGYYNSRDEDGDSYYNNDYNEEDSYIFNIGLAYDLAEKYSPEMKKEIKKALIKGLNEGRYNFFNGLLDIKQSDSFSRFVEDEEVQLAAKNCINKILESGNFYSGEMDQISAIRNNILSPENRNSPEVLGKAIELMTNLLSHHNIDSAFKIQEIFSIKRKVVIRIAKEGILELLRSRYYSDGAIQIKEVFNVPEKFIDTDEIRQAAKEAMINKLSGGDINDAIKIKNAFNLSEEIVVQAAKEGMVNSLSNWHIDIAIRIKDTFNLPEEVINSVEVQQAAKKEMIRRLSNQDIDSAIKIKDAFNLLEETVVQIAKEAMIKRLSSRHIDIAIKIKDAFNLPEKVVIAVAKEEMIKELSAGIDSAIKIKDAFNLPEKVINSVEVQQAAKEGMIKELSNQNIDHAIKIKDAFNLPEEIVVQAAKEGMIERLSSGYVYILHAIRIKDAFNLPEEVINSVEVQQAAKEGMINSLSNQHIDDAIEIKDAFNLPSEFISSAELQQAAKEGMINSLSNGGIYVAIKIKDAFNLAEKVINSVEVQQAAKEGMIKKLSYGYIYDAIKIKDAFNLPEKVVIAAAKEGMIKKLSSGYIYDAIKIKDTFNLPEEVINSVEVQQAAKEGMIKELSAGNIDSVIKIKDAFNLPEEIVVQAAKEGMINTLSNQHIYSAIEIKDAFNLPGEFISSAEVQQAIKSFLVENLFRKEVDEIKNIVKNLNLSSNFIEEVVLENTEKAIKLNKYEIIIKIREAFKLQSDKALDISVSIFGSFITSDLYADIKKFLEVQNPEDIPENLRLLGVNKIGERGISSLREAIFDFKNKVKDQSYRGDGLENPIFESFFKNYVRYESSANGSHDQDSFIRTCDNHRGFYLKGEIKELDVRYKPSKIVSVDKVDRAKQIAFQYSEQFKTRYAVLRRSILDAYKLLDEKRPLNLLFEEFDQIKNNLIDQLEEKIVNLRENPKAKPVAIEQLSKKIDFLKNTNFRSIKDFEGNFTVLSGYKEFDQLLRKMIFYLAFHNYREQRNQVNDNLNEEEPSIDNLSWTLEFIDHITNQETKNKYFKNDLAKDAFIKLTNAKALAEEYNLVQNQDVRGKAKMQFIPTRGLLMEFSGHIADACWASKEDCLARNHPNKSALVMLQNPDSSNERIAGACMLIETESKDGVPLLIIRGLNPIENVITQLSVSDFYQKVTEYLKGVADSLGRKLAVVIDNHRGGSGSNRQAVYDFLSKNCRKNQVTLASSDDTTFNSYNIVNNCYLVE